MTVRFELFVSDVKKAVEFYTKVLGFTKLQSYDNYYPVKKDSVIIGIGLANRLPKNHYFQPEVINDRRGVGVEIVLEVDNIHSLYESVKKTGYPIAEELTQREWGLTDFRLVDPDGYYLRLTSRESE
ncbi:VOC family protein [Candidatus Daviesbacteria bacterium]|nr:VOC family protein [Candidatus Daviesbacteria bacterium]